MKEQPVTFQSSDLVLEGLIAIPEHGPGHPAAVVCHPHPLYGGSMHNNVVDAILAALWPLGYATLRFNFRGVGGSEGEHDGGRGERDDTSAALTYLISRPGVRKEGAMVAGYSFGAMVALNAGLESDAVARVVAVALPVAMGDYASIGIAKKPILMLSGDLDSYSPVAKLKTLAARLGESTRVEVIAGADHFFGGCEDDLTAAISSLLQVS